MPLGTESTGGALRSCCPNNSRLEDPAERFLSMLFTLFGGLGVTLTENAIVGPA